MTAPYEIAGGPAWRAWATALVPVVCLLPFLDKAYHIDDPVYLWIAAHLLEHPTDFFGFQINWTHQYEWVHEFNKNPPGLSYYIAIFAALFGWDERVHHAAFLIPTFFASLAVYRLAARFSARPALASFVAFMAPVYLISNSNIMCEPMMLAFYLWAVHIWIRGLDRSKTSWLVASAFLIGVGILVKYIVVTAIPLLAAYTILRRGTKAIPLLLIFLLPMGIVGAYDLYTLVQYDKSILKDAITYANSVSAGSAQRSEYFQMATNLSFTGGCFLTAALFLPMLFKERAFAVHIGVFALILATVYFGWWDYRQELLRNQSEIHWSYVIQLALYITCGVFIVTLTLHDLWQERNADSVLLLLWVMGIFAFSGYVNWTINGRALLPMAAPVGILVARQLDRPLTYRRLRLACAPAALLAGGLVSMAVSYGDYRYAAAGKAAAEEVSHLTAAGDGTVYFQGHRGFQYYMERDGHQPVDINRMFVNDSGNNFSGVLMPSHLLHLEDFRYGDFAVKPPYDDSIPGALANYTMIKDEFTPHESIQPDIASWVATVHEAKGAGFYSHVHGLLPFYFGPVDTAPYLVFRYDRVEGR